MKIGIFGGSFNPIHIGHALVTNYISQHTDLDQIWLMVAPQNPLKDAPNSNMDIARIRMAEMVAHRLDKVSTSGFEFSLPRPSYTISTLNALKEKFPNDQFVIIIGADNWVSFPKWKNFNDIIMNFDIFVYPRRGYEIDTDKLPERVTFLKDAPMVEVSSTDIREGIKNENNMSFYLPDEVYEYILKNRLYNT